MIFTYLGRIFGYMALTFGAVILFETHYDDEGFLFALYFQSKPEWLYAVSFIGVGLAVGILAELSTVVHRTPE